MQTYMQILRTGSQPLENISQIRQLHNYGHNGTNYIASITDEQYYSLVMEYPSAI